MAPAAIQRFMLETSECVRLFAAHSVQLLLNREHTCSEETCAAAGGLAHAEVGATMVVSRSQGPVSPLPSPVGPTGKAR